MKMASIYSSPIEQFEPKAKTLMQTHPQDDGTDDDNLASSILSNIPRNVAKTTFSSSAPTSSSNKSFIACDSTQLLNHTKLAAAASSTTTSTIDELWTIRQVYNGEEELFAKGKCVYWTRDSIIIKSFNFTNQVSKVFWGLFGNRDHVCVALNFGLSIFNKLGQHFQITLPFAYRDMYMSSLGLLIERNCDSSDDSSLPILFALTHPSKEVSPILMKPNGLDCIRSINCSMNDSMTIVACHETYPICLIYDSDECQHSIWKIRASTKEEIDEFQRMNDESTTTNTFTNQSCSFKGAGAISQASLSNLSNRQRSSLMQQSNTNNRSSNSTLNFSPKVDLKNKHSTLGNLAASRLGVGGPPLPSETVNINTTTGIRSFNSIHTMNMMSTPNRRRILNYLRDNVEEPVMPELTIEQIWVESSNNSLKAQKFFSTKDLVGNEFIVMVTPSCNQLRITKCDNLSIEVEKPKFGGVTLVAAIDAMPIKSMDMMIVIDTNKNFVLYTGFDRLTIIHITQPSITTGVPLRSMAMSSPASLKYPTEITPIQMSSARKRTMAGDRSLGSDTSIHQMFQTLSPVPHAKHESRISTPVSTNDVKKIDHVVGKSVIVMGSASQRVRFDIPTLSQTECIKKLLNSMKALVNRDLGLFMITKWYETRRSHGEPELMSAKEEMRLFKNWFLISIGIECNYFEIPVNPEQSSTRRCKTGSPDLKLSQVSPLKRTKRSKDIEYTNPMLINIHSLFYAMHLVFEDLLLIKVSYDRAYDLSELLIVLACLLKLPEYQEYYWLKFPDLQDRFGQHKTKLENILPKVETLPKPGFFVINNPPSVIDFISKVIDKSQITEFDYDAQQIPFPYIPSITMNTYTVVSLFCEMFQLDRYESIIPISTSTTNYPLDVNILSKRPSRSRNADQNLVQLMVDLGKDRNYLARLPPGINLYLWDSILNCRESPPTNWSEASFNLIGRMDLVNLVRGTDLKMANYGQTNDYDTKKEDDDETLELLFPDDIRVSEARRMLASDIQVDYSIVQRIGATEEETREEAHRHLYLLNIRTMAMPIGRGAFKLRTYSPVIGESFEVPRLELSGRASNEERPIDYNHDISVYPWPFFHNGVAAGLTICASSANNIIDSTWINYNRPRSNIPQSSDTRERDLTAVNINNEHAGFLFALGLNGHLEKLSLMALHDYLCQNNNLTKLAILLGMSAAKRGTEDNNIIKVLSIHVDALLPPNSTELDVPATVHAASILGVGLLYQGSGNSHISKVLLEEIGRLPGPETNSHIDRESYSLSAGLAFGLVNLCKGGSSMISSSDQLRLYMLGGKRKTLSNAQKERYFKQDCHRGEEQYINTHITSPGGTLGLGLMYHRSGNQSVANWMRAPDSQTLLEYVRPDFLILRMLSYGLIMWDEIEPSEEWIKSQIPKIVSTQAFQRNSATHLVDSTTNTNSSVDYELISQAHCNIIAGCCMAIAMKHAGTGNQDAYKTIYKHTKSLITLNDKPSMAEQAGRACIEACLNVLVTSLSVVMAGTGDLGVLRVCRYLRSRLNHSCVFYGSYMAVNIALGVLFLGACRYSLSTSPDSIGALVCALYPIYPNHSSDNRYHLQALRHLYVLAAEPRLLIPRDIPTNRPVYVNVRIRQKKLRSSDSNEDEFLELKVRAPCLMPEVETIEKVYIDDERYWAIEIKDKETLMRCLFQDHGLLSVKQKAHSSNNQLVRDIQNYIIDEMPRGLMKSRKIAALANCVKEDRVEQYSALNELLTKSKKNDKFLSLVFEQLRLSFSMSEGVDMSTNQSSDKQQSNEVAGSNGAGGDSRAARVTNNKMNLLKPVIGDFSHELTESGVYKDWLEYLGRKSDWSSTNKQVAHLICLLNLGAGQTNGEDDELLESLNELNFQEGKE